ncbi:TIR domain-containing protein [Bacillus thuringiensis]|uniref:toll/interleukin-1 receptor domain-containing protein n=1 Tax=Bacillus thuringiensis TaxID=1428 RepID=UPI000BF5F298|nr:toll/interleukin-1 receptor domain-containing protein [Bacillus thuringiensis]PEY63935.1 TIR domain-containing protein [Bacillus thuringiensis]PFM24293.1 TIR domain-containing protein [Bacillus thuringiensis]PFU01715.1 TIR domain-containing protein [Bacillus thuringiensis]
MQIKEELLKLIEEGRLVRTKCYHADPEGIHDYIYGEEYISWMYKCEFFLKKEINDPKIIDDFTQATKLANGNGPKYFEQMIGMLEAIHSSYFDNNMQQHGEVSKIFISHSSMDLEYVKAITDLLNSIGIKKDSKSIFCSSLPGYGIPYGEDIYDFLKEELNQNNIMVLFILSDNYYDSAPCLNEMGATWITSKEYNSILTPNFSYTEVKGAINPTKISFKMDEKDGLNKFRRKIIDLFNLEVIEHEIWEDDRKKFIEKINEIANAEKKNLGPTITLEKIRINKQKECLELNLRFINPGQIPLEFNYIEFNLTDIDSKTITINTSDEQIEDLKLYGKENKIITLEFPVDDSWSYNPRKNVKCTPDFSVQSLY